MRNTLLLNKKIYPTESHFFVYFPLDIFYFKISLIFYYSLFSSAFVVASLAAVSAASTLAASTASATASSVTVSSATDSPGTTSSLIIISLFSILAPIFSLVLAALPTLSLK